MITIQCAEELYAGNKEKLELGFLVLDLLSVEHTEYCRFLRSQLGRLFLDAPTGLMGPAVIIATDLIWEPINQKSRFPGFGP